MNIVGKEEYSFNLFQTTFTVFNDKDIKGEVAYIEKCYDCEKPVTIYRPLEADEIVYCDDCEASF